jgi:hypothetical protein
MYNIAGFVELVSQWEAARKACVRSEFAFNDAVKAYLVGLGPPPSDELVSELAAARESARDCLGSIFLALQHSRETVPLL